MNILNFFKRKKPMKKYLTEIILDPFKNDFSVTTYCDLNNKIYLSIFMGIKEEAYYLNCFDGLQIRNFMLPFF